MQSTHNEDFAPDDPMSELQRAAVLMLLPADIEAIDSAITGVVDDRWRKLSYVVSTAMHRMQAPPGIPDAYVAERTIRLVSAGRFEARGAFDRMRYAEIRRIAAP